MSVSSGFPVRWVLVGELALGPAPLAPRHLDRLQAEGVVAVLSLCSEQEAPAPEGLEHRFCCRRLVLPDHQVSRLLTAAELEQALAALAELHARGPVFVHCVAAVERSPLVCLAWLMRQHGLTRQQALDYLMQVHPGTNPLPAQLAVLSRLSNSATTAD